MPQHKDNGRNAADGEERRKIAYTLRGRFSFSRSFFIGLRTSSLYLKRSTEKHARRRLDSSRGPESGRRRRRQQQQGINLLLKCFRADYLLHDCEFSSLLRLPHLPPPGAGTLGGRRFHRSNKKTKNKTPRSPNLSPNDRRPGNGTVFSRMR